MRRSGLPGVRWIPDPSTARDGDHGGPATCQGRSLDHYKRRVRPCPLQPVARVRGTHGLTADLCARHARMATDLPRLVREWILLEEDERRAAGLAPFEDSQAEDHPELTSAADIVLRLAADLASVAVVRDSLARVLRLQGWAEELHPLVLLAVSEAVANAIEHGSTTGATVDVLLSVDRDGAVVRVSDGGRLGAWLPLRPPAPPSPYELRGRGLLMMGKLAERVEVSSDGRGTRVLLGFSRSLAEPARAVSTVPQG